MFFEKKINSIVKSPNILLHHMFIEIPPSNSMSMFLPNHKQNGFQKQLRVKMGFKVSAATVTGEKVPPHPPFLNDLLDSTFLQRNF